MSLAPLPQTPLVSMMLSTYNHERFIVEAVESALAQDWPAERLEIVVLDDGSADATPELLRPYEDRVRVLRQENQGIRAVVNRLMEEIRGDVILAAAGDDVSPPHRVRTLVEALRANPSAGLVYSDQEIIDDTGARLAPSFMDTYRLPRPSGRIRGQLLRRNVVSGGACMLRGDLKPVVHPLPDHAPWEDYWWAWAISGVADVVYVPEVTYRYRHHGGNVSLGTTGARLAAAQRKEVGYRRWMLAQVRPGEAGPLDVVEGIAQLHSILAQIAQETGEHPNDVVASFPRDEAAAEAHVRAAVAALADNDVTGATFACGAATAAAPVFPPILTLLEPIRAQLHAAPPPVLATRGVEVLADAHELLRRPALLSAYGEQYAGADGVTLVIHGEGADQGEIAGALLPVLAEHGLDGDDAPDMVLVTDVPGGRAALARRASARLGDDVPAALPCALTATVPVPLPKEPVHP